MSKLEKDDFGTLAICAIRYCHGRQTYMPDLVRGIIRPRLKELSEKDLIRRGCACTVTNALTSRGG